MNYYIGNNEINQIFLSERITCISPSDFLLKEDVKITDSLIVLCELDINIKNEKVNRTDYYGISFVQELRRKNYKNKVLFVSFLPHTFFRKKILKARIMSFPGHNFIQLPVASKEWAKKFEVIEVLTDLSLYDVKHHYCGIEQIIDEQFHSLTPKYNSVKQLTPSLIEEGKKLVELIYTSLNKPLPELDEILRADITGPDALRSLRGLCEVVLPEIESKKDLSVEPQWKYWKVLWLDDEENKESPLYRGLVKRLGSEDKVILCSTYEKAKIKWDEDQSYGEISLVICDYRLKGKQGLPTPKQGYDFLKYVADSGRSVGKIAYSGLKRKFLIESFRHYGMQITIYSKIDFNQFNNEDLAFLSDEIIRLGDNHWIEINNAPQATEWKTIATSYHSFKNGFSFYTFQNYISRLAKQNLTVFIDEYNKQKMQEDLWNLTFIDSFKVRTGYFPEGYDNKIESIKEVLIARRFAIGLYAFLRSDRNKQTTLLHSENYLDYIKVILYNSSSNGKGYVMGDFSDSKVFTKVKKHSTLKLIPKFNALTFDSTWPLGLLPEEFGWLKFDMELVKENYEEIYIYLQQIQIIKKNFQYLFSHTPFNKLIFKEDGTIKISGGKIHFNDDNVPLVRNSTDAKKIIQSVYDNLNTNDFEESKIFVSFWRSLVSQLTKGNFRESGLLSDFLHFITKTLRANKPNFDLIVSAYVTQDAHNLKRLIETLISISEILKEKLEKSTIVKNQSLHGLEEYKKLSPLSRGILKNLLNAILKPDEDEQMLIFLIDILEDINSKNIESFVSKIYTNQFFPSNFTCSIEQEYIINHRPWEIVIPRHHRIAANFQVVSDELFKAIESRDLTYTLNILENRNNIFSDALSDFISIYHDPNKLNKYRDIFLRAIGYVRSRADFYNEQKLTDNRHRIRKSGGEISATEYAENKVAQKSYQEQIEYYNTLLDQDENLRLNSEYVEDFDQTDIW